MEVIIFAKNNIALNILLQKFKNKEIEKHYLAEVYGVPKTNKQTLTAYLFKDTKKSLVYISDTPKKGYVKIITSYKIIKQNKAKKEDQKFSCFHFVLLSKMKYILFSILIYLPSHSGFAYARGK